MLKHRGSLLAVALTVSLVGSATRVQAQVADHEWRGQCQRTWPTSGPVLVSHLHLKSWGPIDLGSWGRFRVTSYSEQGRKFSFVADAKNFNGAQKFKVNGVLLRSNDDWVLKITYKAVKDGEVLWMGNGVYKRVD